MLNFGNLEWESYLRLSNELTRQSTSSTVERTWYFIKEFLETEHKKEQN